MCKSAARQSGPTIDESSSGVHLLEVHGTSYGMGFGSFFLLILCGVFGWLFYKRCCRQNHAVNNVATMPPVPPVVGYSQGMVNLPFPQPTPSFPAVQHAGNFPMLQHNQQPLQMLENAFNNLLSRNFTVHRPDNLTDRNVAGRNSDSFIDGLDNLARSGRISEHPPDDST